MILKFLKKLVVAFLMIYSIDLILKGFNIYIPINYWTVSFITFLGFPGLVSLALSFFFLI